MIGKLTVLDNGKIEEFLKAKKDNFFNFFIFHRSISDIHRS